MLPNRTEARVPVSLSYIGTAAGHLLPRAGARRLIGTPAELEPDVQAGIQSLRQPCDWMCFFSGRAPSDVLVLAHIQLATRTRRLPTPPRNRRDQGASSDPTRVDTTIHRRQLEPQLSSAFQRVPGEVVGSGGIAFETARVPPPSGRACDQAPSKDRHGSAACAYGITALRYARRS